MQRNKLSEAIEALQNGRIVVYPTDTLYAFGADIYDEGAVRKVFEIKKRPFDIPLPVAVSNFTGVERIAFVNDNARKLAKHFLPGSLTLILDKKSTIPDIVTSRMNKIAVRIPDNTVALELLSKFGPLTVTSANVHGMETPGIISDINMQVREDDVAVYLDYGILGGSPSTIVDATYERPKIIREGAIAKHDILAVI
ncbi:MAG: L-threonylcarbamoyladenylate synthase [Candidatus Thermoplasmatota archaeon]|nr:L-threonylcarbamoyladenylate synthase [Candidatus Thermoplasmatota archaeon]